MWNVTEKMQEVEWSLSDKVSIINVQISELFAKFKGLDELQFDFNCRIENNNGYVNDIGNS